ncbi:FAD/NAD(P)-binding protein [Streptomyces himalayensis]|uniref:FAD/NAD(P)-binding protein n=1 Tax=Streptomyces himalayensis TaxID=2820085 RepID=UPI00215D6925|nr:FAD/NAD(P)-binding protein [Streptomyces himalayensis]
MTAATPHPSGPPDGPGPRQTRAAVALVGAGPRGTSVLERLCASAPELLSPRTQLTVHVIDPSPPGAGRVWRTAQPSELLMNTVASQVTLFTDDSVDCSGPVRPGPSLYEWAAERDGRGDRGDARGGDGESGGGSGESGGGSGCKGGSEDKGGSGSAYGLRPDDYPTRAYYGRYLEWVFGEVVRGAPPAVRVEVHTARAVKLDDEPDGRQRLVLDSGVELRGLSAVVLAQGHLPVVGGPAQERLAEHARRHDLRHFPPANPADLDLSAVAPGEPVLLRGLGLNFFDHMALLTEGRGGRYVPGNRGLRYLPSGSEPRLYAGSRRGVPYQARGDNAKGPYGRHQPAVLTPEAIAGFRKRADSGDPPDFLTEIWPLVAKEVETVYYEALLARRPGRRDADADADRGGTRGDSTGEGPGNSAGVTPGCPPGRTPGHSPARTPGHSPARTPGGSPARTPGRSPARTPEDFRDRFLATAHRGPQEALVLDEFGIAAADRWSWDRISRPYGDRSFSGPGDFRDWLLAYLREDAAQAALGNVAGPVKAALDVLRDLRNELRQIVDHGGLAGASRRDHLDRWYTPLNAFLSIGPPRRRIEEMAALIEAGVLEVLGPRLEVRPVDGAFAAHSPDVPGSAVRVTTLVEARLPEPDLRRTADDLLAGLLKTGQCRPHSVGRYETGGLDVTPRPYRLIDRQGRPHPRRFAFGVTTEGVHWVTAAGARPGVDSVTLSDADAVAREVLRTAPGLRGDAEPEAKAELPSQRTGGRMLNLQPSARHA